ncbi:MAG TPA: 2-octaprenyl-6-methoxyphenyl hydroxylase [Steroidobacteraceae bacterium]|nr:2-octaprenyl-6-methoxyphenyl hydroxylase [Steroidobacteraceae bacterium]
MREVDVVIVGGGMVGASLALALAGTGLDVTMIEGVVPGTQAQPSFDDRTTALGNASRRIFEGLGVWGDIAPQAAAIRTIHVSDAGRFGFARLNAREQGIDAFGYVVTNRVIGAALWAKLAAAKGITVRAPAHPQSIDISADAVRLTVVDDRGRSAGTREGGASNGAAGSPAQEEIKARLIVAADGAHSSVRAAAGIGATIEDYEQVAIVANLAADRPHDGTAYERFTPTGPLALLPLFDGSYGLVWSKSPPEASRVLALDDASFLVELQQCFGWRAGRFTRAGRRASYPLKLTRAATTVARRAVLIGNAAQALHPVAGQGFNLGLRDAAMLAEVLASAPAEGRDAGSEDLLARFERWRAGDRSGVIRFTDGLIKLFGDTRPGMTLARNFGLLLFDLTPPAKSALARVSAGFAGPAPRLARGLALR